MCGLLVVPFVIASMLVANCVQPALARNQHRFLAVVTPHIDFEEAESTPPTVSPDFPRNITDLKTLLRSLLLETPLEAFVSAPKSVPDEHQASIRDDRIRWRARVWREYIFDGLVSWVIWLALSLLVYNVAYPRPVPHANNDATTDLQATLDTGHFDCFSDADTCVNAWFCWGPRWADSQKALGVTSCGMDLKAGPQAFWIYFCFFMASALLNVVTYNTLFFGLFTTVLLVWGRQQIRERFQMQYCTCWTVCIDCLYACWCPCCLIAQEARAVNAAYSTGVLIASAD